MLGHQSHGGAYPFVFRRTNFISFSLAFSFWNIYKPPVEESTAHFLHVSLNLGSEVKVLRTIIPPPLIHQPWHRPQLTNSRQLRLSGFCGIDTARRTRTRGCFRQCYVRLRVGGFGRAIRAIVLGNGHLSRRNIRVVEHSFEELKRS